MMRHLLSWVLIVLAGCSAHAELRVMIELEHATCLQFESVNVMVFFLNETHETLTIGTAGASDAGVSDLRFVVEHGNDVWLKKTPQGTLRPFSLRPGEERSLVIELTDWYPIHGVGGYRVQALVDTGHKRYASPMVQLTVVPGIELLSDSKLLPGSEGRLRKYRVLYWKRGMYEYAFLRVDEVPGDLNYGVFQLGRLVRFTKPRLLVTLDGEVTVRHQSAADCFIRTRFQSGAGGVRFVDQTYELPNGSPHPNSESRLGIPLPDERK